MIIIKYAECEDNRGAQHITAEKLRNEILEESFFLADAVRHISVLPQGKPVIDIPGIDFSVTHSHRLAAAAVCGETTVKSGIYIDESVLRIGIDAEKIRYSYPESKIKRISERFFSAEEQEIIFSCESHSEKIKNFFKIWTLKESICKMTGEGLAGIGKYSAKNLKDKWITDTREIMICGEYYYLSFCAEKNKRS